MQDGDVVQQTASGDSSSFPVTGRQYSMEQLADYDYLMKNFYNVHTVRPQPPEKR